MYVNISDLLYAGGESFEDVLCTVPAEFDSQARDRIKACVMERIGKNQPARTRKMRRVLRTALLAVAAALLLSVTAYAVSVLFGLHADPVQDSQTVSGTWTERDADGNVKNVLTWTYQDAGMVFTFEGGTAEYYWQFKPGYLPGEPTDKNDFGCDEGWYSYLTDSGSGSLIPYVIQIIYAEPEYQLVLNGKCEIVAEEEWNGCKLTEISADWTDNPYRQMPENYVLMFSEENGYMISVGGTSDMETLEHIAKELQVGRTDVPYASNLDILIGILNVGRG